MLLNVACQVLTSDGQFCQYSAKLTVDCAVHQVELAADRQMLVLHSRSENLQHRCLAPVTADKPAQMIEKSIASPSVLAVLLTTKYADGLPLYRFETVLSAMASTSPRQTLACWVIQCGEQLQPLLNLLRDKLLVSPVKAMRRMVNTIKHWRIHRSTTDDLRDFSRRYNAVIRGWIEYYGKFWYRNFSYRLWSALQSRLLKWMKSKYRISIRQAEHRLRLVRRENPELFAHWYLLRASNG